MNSPTELRYTKTHEWVKVIGENALVGITDFAQKELGDIVFINLPNTGEELVAGETFADVESVKAVSDIISPVSGVVEEVNEKLLDAPEMINQAPYETWIVRLKGILGLDSLLTAEQYEKFLHKEV